MNLYGLGYRVGTSLLRLQNKQRLLVDLRQIRSVGEPMLKY